MNIMKLLKPKPYVGKKITNPDKIDKMYKYWRIRMMYSMMIGYCAFYLVRANFSMAMPVFVKDLGISLVDLGIVLSLFSIIYGAGKFLNGIIADRSNPRYFMSIGLLCSGLVSLLLGFSTGIIMISFLWLINAWFQSMGWPPCARGMTKWFPPTRRGLAWGIWNASHQIGAIITLILTGYLIQHFSWRWAFIVPAVLVLVVMVPLLMNRLRDDPASMGLPNVKEYEPEAYADHEKEKRTDTIKESFKHHILPNKTLWLLCVANFFVYIVRMGIFTWTPLFLLQSKGIDLVGAGWSTAAFEFAGIFGSLLAGFLSDRLQGQRGKVNTVFTAFLVVGLLLLYCMPSGSLWLSMIVLSVIGFMVYGPQMLVGLNAADVSGSNAAATASGLTGTFGYVGSTVCGIMIGVIVAKWGWEAGLLFFVISGICALACFLLTWNAKAR